ncbi:MAG: outer membrane protein transport protein, partial [Planctomycetota bacterium]|nr:outer membrane protein transport protein [Planctomycetota bacterium]
LGVTYKDETRMRLGGNARVEIPGLGQTYYDTELDWVWPRSVGLGLQHQACACRRYGADVIWYDWSGAFEQLDLKFRDPTNPLFEADAGPRVDEAFPLFWRDSISVRMGVEQSLNNNKVVRMGYAWNRNPIPTATLTNFIPAVLEHTFSTGYGWKVAGYELDLAYQFSYGPTHHVQDSLVLGGDFDNSRIRTHAHWLMFSVMRRR